MSKFLKKLKKSSGNQFAFVADEEDNVYSYDKMYGTGCYILNSLISGDIYGGIIPGRRYMIAGPPSTGKSYFTSLMLKSYLEQKPKCLAIIFESEGSTVLEMADSVGSVESVAGNTESLGINKDRMLILPIKTIEDCRTQCMKLLGAIREENQKIKDANQKIREAIDKQTKALIKTRKAKTPNEDKIKSLTEEIANLESKIQDEEEFIFLIDSLGNLSTNKETADIESGDDKVDMTKAKKVRAFSRVSALEFSLLKIPLLVVNHTYKALDQYTPDQVSGGGGPMYFSDVCLTLTKGKEKDNAKKQIGVVIGVTVMKGRFTKEGIMAHIIISFKHGLYPYSALEHFGKELGVFGMDGNKYILPDGTIEKTTTIRKEFKKYANETNMNAIADAIRKEFKFGQVDDVSSEIDVTEIVSVDEEE